MNRQLKWVCISSIMLNLVLVGVLAGFVLKQQHSYEAYKEKLKAERNQILKEVVMTMPEAEQQALLPRIEADSELQKASYRHINQLRQEMAEVMAAEQFDVTEFETISEDIHATYKEMAEQHRLLLIQIADNLPLVERQKIAATLAKQGKGAKK